MFALERPLDLTSRLHGNFYKPQPGHFGIVQDDGVVWMSCRDEVQKFRPRQLMFVTTDKANVIRFMKKIQDVINLEDRDRLLIEETTDANILSVRLSKFWQRNVNRSLLTALLRAGQYYAPRTRYKAALKKVPYFDNSYAVNRFLSGFTKYRRRRFYGWQYTFDDMPKCAIRKCLVAEKRR